MKPSINHRALQTKKILFPQNEAGPKSSQRMTSECSMTQVVKNSKEKDDITKQEPMKGASVESNCAHQCFEDQMDTKPFRKRVETLSGSRKKEVRKKLVLHRASKRSLLDRRQFSYCGNFIHEEQKV
jgi:hypothetical protein